MSILHNDALLGPIGMSTTTLVGCGSPFNWLGHHPFSELHASAGELLRTPQRVPAFMATVLLSRASNILWGI